MQDSETPNKTTHIRVFEEDHQRLMSLKNQSGLRSIAHVVNLLLKKQVRKVTSVEALMQTNVPVVLTGKPGSGKTYFIKNKLLPSLEGYPLLLIDSLHEYKELKDIGYNLQGLNFEDFSRHIRFAPSTHSIAAEADLQIVFSTLDLKRDELSKWVIIVEEAHAYKHISAFNKFLYGGRHHVRKIIAVTPQTDAFQGLEVFTILPFRRD